MELQKVKKNPKSRNRCFCER